MDFRFRTLGAMMLGLVWGAAAGADPTLPGGAQPLVVAAESGGGHEGHTASSPAAAWADLRGVRDAIAADLEAGRLDEIHAKSERLEPLAKALLEASKDLAADKRARVESAVKQMPKVAGILHEAADAGNADATRRELKRLDGVLELMRAQYPPDALSSAAPSAGGDDHAMHGPAHGASGAAGQVHAERPLAAVDVPAKATLRVRSNEFGFEPRVLELRAGEPTRIELVNEGAIEHALVVEAPDASGEWIHLHAAPGATTTGVFRVDAPGEYRVKCTIAGHLEAGMDGRLVVAAP